MKQKIFLSNRTMQGRTLLELMVAMAIGLVILAALGAVYVATTGTARQSTGVSRINEDVSIAFSLLGAGTRMAGYSPPVVLVLPGGALVNGAKKTAPDRNFIGAAIRGCDYGFVDAKVANFSNLTCQTADTTKSAAFAVRFEGDDSNTAPLVTTTPGSVSLATDCLNQGVKKETESALASIINDTSKDKYALIESRFTAVNSSSNGTPELFCGGNGGAKDFKPEPMIQFVEGLQLRYGIAKDAGSRDVSQYATAAEIDALSGSVDDRWSRVVNIRICMVMRSQDKQSGAAGNYLNCDGASVASSDGYARRAFTTFYALRNRSGFLTP